MKGRTSFDDEQLRGLMALLLDLPQHRSRKPGEVMGTAADLSRVLGQDPQQLGDDTRQGPGKPRAGPDRAVARRCQLQRDAKAIHQGPGRDRPPGGSDHRDPEDAARAGHQRRRGSHEHRPVQGHQRSEPGFGRSAQGDRPDRCGVGLDRGPVFGSLATYLERRQGHRRRRPARSLARSSRSA